MDRASEHTTLPEDDCTTVEAARLLGLAVRSVQLMVDRGELRAWRTPGGHRRISRASVETWLAQRQRGGHAAAASPAPGASTPAPLSPKLAAPAGAPRDHGRQPVVLLIEDSRHYQNLVSLLVKEQFPEVELHLADDGIIGLAMAGRLQPDMMLVDILLPGIDGATLVTRLRSHPDFGGCRLVVVTSLDEDGLRPYAFALGGIPVVHKTRLVTDLPRELAVLRASRDEPAAMAAR